MRKAKLKRKGECSKAWAHRPGTYCKECGVVLKGTVTTPDTTRKRGRG